MLSQAQPGPNCCYTEIVSPQAVTDAVKIPTGNHGRAAAARELNDELDVQPGSLLKLQQ
jgi:hypothetical protein